MHISRGRPLISALHEPHLPALQFQRTARSPAWVAWRRWMTSRTTSPSSTPRVVAQLAAACVAAPDAHREVVSHQVSWSQRCAARTSCSELVGHDGQRLARLTGGIVLVAGSAMHER